MPKSNGQGVSEYNSKFSPEHVALIVLESRPLGVAETARKYGVSRQAVVEWRKLVHTDPTLKKAMAKKTQQYVQDFDQAAADAMRSCLDFIKRAGKESDPSNPAHVRAVAGAYKMVMEGQLAAHITYSRIGRNLELPVTSAEETYTLSPGDEVVMGDFEELKEIDEAAEE